MVCQNCQKLHEQNVEYAKLVTQRNDYIKELQKEQIELKEDLDKKNKKITKLNAQVTTQRRRIDDLTDRIAKNKKSVFEEIKEEIEGGKQAIKRNDETLSKLMAENKDLKEKVKGLQRANQDLMDKDKVSLNLYNENEINNINKISPQKFAEMDRNIKDLSNMLFNIKISTDSLHKAISSIHKEMLEKLYEKKEAILLP